MPELVTSLRRPKRGIRLVVAVSFSLSTMACRSGLDSSAELASKGSAHRAIADHCLTVPGYQTFRAELEQVVASRNGKALRVMFHPEGAMRVNGIGGPPIYPDWGFDRPEMAVVWEELEEILKLGCIQQGGRLILPATAGMVGLVEPGYVVTIRAVNVVSKPEGNATVIKSLEPGKVLRDLENTQPPGWTRVESGWVPTDAVRSPYSLRLELAPYDGSWRIRAFSANV